MPQISNVNDTKIKWNMNETHIIIPMIDGDVIPHQESEKVITNTITVNTFDGEDQTVLTNGLETSFVIGLDKNLFDTHNKSDFIVVQNSELKSSVAYTVSYIDQDKGEIFWESPILKDRIKEWCINDKTVFEVKDVLHTEQCLENSTEQINLDDTERDLTAQICKYNKKKFFEDNLKEEKTCSKAIENGDHLIVNCIHDCNICEKENFKNPFKKVFPNTRFLDKLPENDKTFENFKQYEITSEKETPDHEFPNVIEDYEESVSSTYSQCETDISIKLQSTKDDKNMTVSSSLPEKSLPLKKKAKMKTTMTLSGCENVWSSKSEVEDVTKKEKNCSQPKLELIPQNSSDSDKPLVKKTKRQLIKAKSKKVTVLKNKTPNSLVSKLNQEEEMSRLDEPNHLNNDKASSKSPKNISLSFEESKVNSITDLVGELKRCRIINASVWQTLLSGLKEMDIDILHEIISKKKEKTPVKSSSYSPQLKAFALVLYFKQPAAFNYLTKLYGNGWPSLDVIKDWKRRINNHQRPDFVGVPRETL